MRKFVLLSKAFICSFQFVFAQSSSKEITDKVGLFDKYTGKFTNETYGDAEVIFSGNDLTLKFPNNISLALKH